MWHHRLCVNEFIYFYLIYLSFLLMVGTYLNRVLQLNQMIYWIFFIYFSYKRNTFSVFFGRYGAGYDLAARRKNATRESTATLKAWLNEHKKNPYPTKGEKIMLAIITKMTLTQVSTWFANARRRLKKENKMTWEPKNKTEDDDDGMVSDDDKEKDDEIEKQSVKGESFLMISFLWFQRLTLLGVLVMNVIQVSIQRKQITLLTFKKNYIVIIY